MLLHVEGILLPLAAGSARPRGRLSGDLPRPHRRPSAKPAGRRPGAPRRCGCAPTPLNTPSTTCCTATYTGVVDDFVLRRGDGVPAYNLAVVVDDAAPGVDQVVRGDDLLASAPRQAYLATARPPRPVYAHVPWCSTTWARLAKRDGAVTLAEIGVRAALSRIGESLGYRRTRWQACSPNSTPAIAGRPWIYRPG